MSNKIIDIKLTYRCNNDCKYCCQDRKLRSVNSDLSVEKIKNIIQNEKDIDKVVLTGGEATLSPIIIKIIRIIKKTGIENIQLQTNAKKLRDKEFLNSIIEAGVSSFGISLHGCTKNMHEQFTGTKGSFDDVIIALNNIKEFKYPVALNCVITKHSVNYLKQIYGCVCDNKFASSIQFAFIHITGKALDGVDDFVTISEASKGVRRVLEEIRCNENHPLNVFTEAIPFCLMEGFEKNVSELRNHADVITYDFRERCEFSEALSNVFKQKGPNCTKCLFYNYCDGTWREYPELYGYDEFVPVTSFRSEY